MKKVRQNSLSHSLFWINQYLNVVKPMHNQFIEPTKKYADIIIPEGGSNKVAIDIMTTKIQTLVSKQ